MPAAVRRAPGVELRADRAERGRDDETTNPVPRSPDSVALTIPDSYVDALVRLAALEGEEYATFLAALQRTEPSMSMERFAARVAERASRDRDETQELIELLADLYLTREREVEDALHFAEQVCDAARSTHRRELAFGAEDAEAFGRKLTELLDQNETLGAAAKALDVLVENEHLYCRTRVLSDLRPLFLPGSAESPAASVVVHALRITYHEGAPTKQFFLALSTDDLHDLRRQVDRAIAKDASLRSAAEGAGMPAIPSRTEERRK